MKKSALFSIFALGLAMVSCEDFDYPNPPAQSNEQLPVLDASGVTVSPVTPSGTVDLKAMSDGGQRLQLGKLDATGEYDAALYDFTFAAEMAGSEDFAGAIALPCETSGNVASVLPGDVEAAFHEIFKTIDPAPKAAWFRLKTYAQNKETGTKYRVNGEKAFYAVQSISVAPYPPAFTVEEKYYLVGAPTDGKIQAEGAVLLKNGGGSPYDDPNFSAIITVTPEQAQGGYNWAIVPESTMAAGSGLVLAPTFEYTGEVSQGLLSDQTELGNWNTIYNAGSYLLSVNVKANEAGYYTFSYIQALENLWINGAGNGWDWAKGTPLYTNDYLTYLGYAHLNQEFKIAKSNDWDHGDYGGNDKGELTNGGSNIPVDKDGLFWVEANIDAMTYSLTYVEFYGIIGNATAGGWDAPTKMTPSEDFLTWTITTDLTAGQFKFRANDNWDVNLGGLGEDKTPQEPELELTPGGSDIEITEAGKYDIVLDLTKLPYSCKLIKK